MQPGAANLDSSLFGGKDRPRRHDRVGAESGSNSSSMSNRILDLTLEPVVSLPCRFGRYRLTKLLAQGGMAQIYLAKAFGAEGFVKPLVIKRLTPSLTANQYFATLFVTEAKLLVDAHPRQHRAGLRFRTGRR